MSAENKSSLEDKVYGVARDAVQLGIMAALIPVAIFDVKSNVRAVKEYLARVSEERASNKEKSSL